MGVTEYVDTCAVGYLMQKEIDFLGNAVETPVRPFVAILGDVYKRQVRFREPQRAITPGQAVVFYKDGYVAGGGIIEGAVKE